MKNASFLVENLIYHRGKKPYDEIVKKDNSKIGLIIGIVILIGFLIFSIKKY